MNTWTPAATANKQPASAGTLGEKGRCQPSAQKLTLEIIGAIKLPPNQKGKETGKKRLKGHGPKHIQYTRLHIYAILCDESGPNTRYFVWWIQSKHSSFCVVNSVRTHLFLWWIRCRSTHLIRSAYTRLFVACEFVSDTCHVCCEFGPDTRRFVWGILSRHTSFCRRNSVPIHITL